MDILEKKNNKYVKKQFGKYQIKDMQKVGLEN